MIPKLLCFHPPLSAGPSSPSTTERATLTALTPAVFCPVFEKQMYFFFLINLHISPLGCLFKWPRLPTWSLFSPNPIIVQVRCRPSMEGWNRFTNIPLSEVMKPTWGHSDASVERNAAGD